MGSRIDPTIGMILFDDRLSPDSEMAQAAGGSQYTEALPQPGTPVPSDVLSAWRPQVEGAQETAIDMRAIRGGYPGVGGCSVVYRLDTDAGSHDWRGWDEPNVVSGWTSPSDVWGSGDEWYGVSCCTIPASGIVVVVATNDGGAGDRSKAWRYNPRTETWQSGYDFAAHGIVLSMGCAVAWDADAQLLILRDSQVTYSSSDLGDSWQVHGIDYDADAPLSPGRLAIQPGKAWLYTRAISTSGQTYSSLDHGASWQLVSSPSIYEPAGISVVALPSGGYLGAFISDASTDACVIRLATADTELAPLYAEVIGVGTYESIVAAVDDDGTIYVLATTDAASLDPSVRIWRSTDDGVTFTQYAWNILDLKPTVPGPHPVLLDATCSNGQLHVLVAMNTSTAANADWALLSLGGWTSVEAGVGAPEEFGERTGRIGFGHTTAAGVTNSEHLWLPFDTPDAVGGPWAHGGAGAAMFMGVGVGGVIATAAQASYYEDEPAHEDLSSGMVWVQPGKITATTDSEGIRIRSANTTFDYEAIITVATTQIEVYDVHAPFSTIYTVDASAGLHIRWTIRAADATSCTLTVWWREPGATVWTRHGENLTEKGSARATADRVRFGHLTAITSTSTWRYFGWRAGADWASGLPSVATGYLHPETDRMPLLFGRALPARAAGRYPVPDLTAVSSDLGFVSGSGRAYTGELVNLPVGHQRPIESAYPTVSPSPSRYWESTDDAEVRLAWKLPGRSWIGGGFALAVLGAYGRQWALEYDDLSTGWTTAGTLDLALGTGLSATRQGDTVFPRSGTATISRYIQEGELIGGYVIIGSSGGNVGRRIVRNSGGFWSPSSTVQQVVLVLEGIDGTEDSSATIDLIHHSGVMVVYPSTPITRSKWRVRAAASQVTPSGTYRAGLIGVGRVVGLGAETSWDWAHRLQLERVVARDRTGTPTVARRGKPRRVLEAGWRDGIALLELRELTADPDYVAVSGGAAIGSEEDPWFTLWGLLEHALDSGEVPCVLLPQLPSTSGTTITDRSMYVYGRAMIEAHGAGGFLGTEGVDEMVRLDSITVEEIR